LERLLKAGVNRKKLDNDSGSDLVRGLSDAAKDLLFEATTRGCGTELLRHAHCMGSKQKPRDIAPGLSLPSP
jgi:hypothetical protein